MKSYSVLSSFDIHDIEYDIRQNKIKDRLVTCYRNTYMYLLVPFPVVSYRSSRHCLPHCLLQNGVSSGPISFPHWTHLVWKLLPWTNFIVWRSHWSQHCIFLRTFSVLCSLWIPCSQTDSTPQNGEKLVLTNGLFAIQTATIIVTMWNIST